MITLEEITGDNTIFEALLRDQGITVKGKNLFKCIFHEDKSPSAGLYQKNGAWKYKCFSCGVNEDYFGIMGKLNRTERNFEIRTFFEPTSTKDGVVRPKNIDKKPEGLLEDFEDHVEKRITGEFTLLPMFFEGFEQELRHSLPGCITGLCGGPGSGKSFFINQMVIHLLLMGYKPALLALEENENFHTYRALAQIAGKSKIMDPTWAENNPDEVREIYREFNLLIREYLNNILKIPNKKIVSYSEVLMWVRNRIRNGYDYLFIDPVTAINVDGKRHIEDQNFLNELKGMAEDSGVRVMLATHPKQQIQRVESLSNMAGGTAFERFCQNILWISRVDWNKSREIWVNGHTEDANFNTTVRKLKGRNGPLFDMALWGFQFDVNTLNFREIGLMKSIKNT